MTDILERLRRYAGDMCISTSAEIEAADIIEGLQKENGALCAAVKTLQGEKAELIEALCQPSYEEENRLRAEVAKLRAEVKDRNDVIARLQNELRTYRERERWGGTMIDMNELRRLAQAATPGPWKACRSHECYEGTYFEIDPEDEAEYAAKPFTHIQARAGAVTEAHDLFEFDRKDAEFIAAANPEAITELLDRLEAWENVFDHLGTPDEVGNEWHSLSDRLEAAEKDNKILREALAERVISETMLRDLSVGNGSINANFEGGAVHLLVDALAGQFSESGSENYLEMHFHSPATGPLVATLQRVNGKTPHQLREAAEKETKNLREGLKRMCLDEDAAAKEAKALRAKIAEMEQQEPVAWMSSRNGFICKENKNPDYNVPLYALPGAQPVPSVPEGFALVSKTHFLAVLDREDWRTAKNRAELRAMLAAAPEAKP